MKDPRRLKISGPPSQNNDSRHKRCVELQRRCHLAVTLGEQTLIGIPHENRVEFSPAYAPFNPENLSTWREAANLGIPNGCYLLGQCLVNNGEIEEGLRWLRIAISKKQSQAKRALGESLLDNGDIYEGLKLLNEAADSGDAYACHALAMRYQEGEGVPKSRLKYRSYLERAAQLGSCHARNCLDADNLISGWSW